MDLDITFETGSWQLSSDQVERLSAIADALNRAISRNPSEVFLIEGHTDAVGSDVDNLSLSDRRAESVAVALSEEFHVPAENLVTQGYGKQDLKIQTNEPERANRRVAIRWITPLIDGEADLRSRRPGTRSEFEVSGDRSRICELCREQDQTQLPSAECGWFGKGVVR